MLHDSQPFEVVHSPDIGDEPSGRTPSPGAGEVDDCGDQATRERATAVSDARERVLQLVLWEVALRGLCGRGAAALRRALLGARVS